MKTQLIHCNFERQIRSFDRPYHSNPNLALLLSFSVETRSCLVEHNLIAPSNRSLVVWLFTISQSTNNTEDSLSFHPQCQATSTPILATPCLSQRPLKTKERTLLSTHAVTRSTIDTAETLQVRCHLTPIILFNANHHTANEFRALQSLPLEKLNDFYIYTRSLIDVKIHQLLEQSERNRDVSLLDEAGRLLWEQATRPYIANPAITYPPTFLSGHEFDNTDLPSQVDYTQSDFAKVAITPNDSRNGAATNPDENREMPTPPKSTPYPDKLVNPTNLWLPLSAPPSGNMAKSTNGYPRRDGQNDTHNSTESMSFGSAMPVLPSLEENSRPRLNPQQNNGVMVATKRPEPYAGGLFYVRATANGHANELGKK